MEMMLYVIRLYINFEELKGNIRSRKIKKREIIIRIVLIFFLFGIFLGDLKKFSIGDF